MGSFRTKLERFVSEVEGEMAKWQAQKSLEDSPLGGNVVKAAHYGGTAAGLKMALQIFAEVMDE